MKKVLTTLLLSTCMLFCSISYAANKKHKVKEIKPAAYEVCCDVGFVHCGEPLCINMCAETWQQLSNDILWWQHVLDFEFCP